MIGVGRGVAVAVLLATGALPRVSAAMAQEAATRESRSLEYDVKAAYLLNFTRYVQWPPSAFAHPDSPLVICVIGHDPFRSVLEQTVEGQVTDGHPISIRRRSLASDVGGCHVAFIAPEPEDVHIPLVDQDAAPPILTVGEGTAFARRGGMIGLVIVDATVRFEVDLEAVRRSGLRLSSRVLALATRVYGRGEEE